MVTNKILRILVGATGIIVVPVQMLTTLILGLFVSIPIIGVLLLLLMSSVWTIIFLGPLLGLSYVYEKIKILRPLSSIIGVPLALIGNAYVALIPSMGEKESRYAKMFLCQSFPYTWGFNKFYAHNVDIYNNLDLMRILLEVTKGVAPLRYFLASIVEKNMNSMHQLLNTDRQLFDELAVLLAEKDQTDTIDGIK